MATFPARTIDEIKVYTFDFSSEVPSTATLSSPIIEKSLHAGTDTDATAWLLGSPSVDGFFVMASGAEGIEGCTYKLRAKVEDDNGQVHVMWAYASIKESAGKALENA